MNGSIDIKSFARDGKVVNLRCIAILFVVFGHSIILYSDSWNYYSTTWDVPSLDMIKKWIDLIQMPLFFGLSGYLFWGNYKKISFITLVYKKTIRILIPYILVALFWLIPIRKISHYKGYVGLNYFEVVFDKIVLGNDNGHLWFLPCLFLCFIFSFMLFKLFDKIQISEFIKTICLYIIACIMSYYFYIIPQYVGSEILRSFAMNWIWFCFGALICKHKKYLDIMTKIKPLIVVVSLILSSALILNLISNIRITKCIMLTAFFLIVSDSSNKFTEFIDKNSFGIYLFHSPLVYITYAFISESHPLMVVMINSIVFGILSIILTLCIRKTKLKIILGE